MILNKINLNKDKKANLLSIWWFFVLAIVGTGIVIGTLKFYGADTNVKKLEADILSDRVINCVVNQGVINSKFIEGNFNIFSNCGLYEDLLSNKNRYMIKVQTIDDKGNTKDIVRTGLEMEKDCNIRENVLSAPKYPFCSTKILELLDSNGNLIKLKVVTGSNYEKGDLYNVK